MSPQLDTSAERPVTRGELIGDGLRWCASWGLRAIVILLALWVIQKALAPLWVALLPLILALLLTTVLWPPARFLLNRGCPPALSAVISLLLGFLVLAGVIGAIIPSVVDQSDDLATKAIGGVEQLRDWAQGPPLNIRPEQIEEGVNAVTGRLRESGDAIASGVFTGVSTAGNLIVTLLLSLVLTFFLIKDGPTFLPWLRRSTGEGPGAHLTEVLFRMWTVLGGFIRTQALVSLVDAVFIGIGLVILGVPLALALAVLTFLGGFVPIVGATVAGALAVLVALVTQGWVTALIVLGIVLAVQQIEGNVLQPVLQSRSMNLHPALVLLSVTAGSYLQGIIGAFLAVPVAAMVVVAVRYINEQIELRTGDKSPDDCTTVTPHGVVAARAGEAAGKARAAARDD